VVIGLIAGLVVLIVIAVVLIIALGGNDESDTTANGGSGASTPTAPSAPSNSSPSGGFPSAPSGPVDPAEFVAQLPSDFTDCAAATLAGDGDLAAAACGLASTQPGPLQAVFHLYPDQATLDSVFQSQVTEQGMTAFADGADCSTATGYGEWSYSDQTRGGQVACQITGEGDVLVAWTDDEFLTEGAVRAPGNSQAEIGALYDWWTVHSDFQR
jgi:hypothetical protein